jgi:predicted SnoaL-like aldol condensation-catalyzing enzyme
MYRLAAALLVAAGLAACSVVATYPESARDAARNRELVVAFYTTVFVEKQVAEGFARYVGPAYIQHNPRAPDGPEAAVKLLSQVITRDSISEIKRIVAENDLVVLHVHSRANAQDRGRAIVDIFRVENGKIVEHWDVIQPVPEQAANGNTMF